MSTENVFPAPKAFKSSLRLIATSYSLRCDAKYADTDVLDFERSIRTDGFFELGYFLPNPFIKGIQPNSLDQPLDDSVPVINTLSIQNLSIREEDCRHITREDYDSLTYDRKLRRGDVLLTVDGGVSIGKAVLFESEQDFTVDSHVSILRPEGLDSLALVYLLASPMGQMQFRRAESGASGQTTVTEDDIRRFIFPRSLLANIDEVVATTEAARKRIAEQRLKLNDEERELWKQIGKLSK
jgi:hypothetical protein